MSALNSFPFDLLLAWLPFSLYLSMVGEGWEKERYTARSFFLFEKKKQKSGTTNPLKPRLNSQSLKMSHPFS